MNNKGNIDKAWALLQKKRPEYALPTSPPSNRCFTLLFSVPKNTFGVPCKVEIEIRWGDHFPYDDVEAFSKDSHLVGFPHQMAADGKLCLEREIRAVADESLLFRTVEGVENWLKAMASNSLLKEGDVYELPDFGFFDDSRRNYSDKKLYYLEDEGRFVQFLPYMKHGGFCKLLHVKSPNVIVPREFSVGGWAGEKIKDINFSLCTKECEYTCAAWVLLPSILVEHHRPPKKWSELYGLADKAGIQNLGKLLREVWEQEKEDVYLLIGWPIPDKVGGDDKTIAWCACVFKSERFIRKTRKGDYRTFGKHRNKAANLWRLSEPGGDADVQLHWVKCENVAYRNYTARWKLDNSIVDKKVLLVGCGAIGSEVSDLLVRGGLKSLGLVDKEKVEFGNLCRHVVSAMAVDMYKSDALKFRLSLVNPISTIDSLPGTFIGDAEIGHILDKYDLLIDCTADDKITTMLARNSRSVGVPYVKLFINPTAEYLTLIISGTCIRGDEVLFKLWEGIAGCDAIDIDEYQGHDAELSVMAPGCWHPTYPGRWVDIKILVGMAIEILEGRLKSGIRSDGFGAVICRRINEAGFPETRVVYSGEFTR